MLGDGHAWGDMAIICRHYSEMDECAGVLSQRGLPYQVRMKAGWGDTDQRGIKVMTLHVSKGLEFPVVALVGAGRMPKAKASRRKRGGLVFPEMP